ncbi:hypothetical protein G4Y73_10745 [Wenzhouxiangella sp. XN201]|nr:hypothetical protein [Wenzhouxiangella sp. XN201]
MSSPSLRAAEYHAPIRAKSHPNQRRMNRADFAEQRIPGEDGNLTGSTGIEPEPAP